MHKDFLIIFLYKNIFFQYVLCCVDQFNLFTYTRPLKSKNVQEVSQQFDSIISSNNNKSPDFVYADAGTELNFLQNSFEKYEITRYFLKKFLMNVYLKNTNILL